MPSALPSVVLCSDMREKLNALRNILFLLTSSGPTQRLCQCFVTLLVDSQTQLCLSLHQLHISSDVSEIRSESSVRPPGFLFATPAAPRLTAVAVCSLLSVGRRPAPPPLTINIIRKPFSSGWNANVEDRLSPHPSVACFLPSACPPSVAPHCL